MKLFTVSILALAALTAPAFAACKDFPIVTADTAAVNRTAVVKSTASSLGGTAYTKATFCPKASAAGTCTGETLVGSAGDALVKFVTFDGTVADIERHRNGLQIGPVFIPLTGFIPGAC